MLIRREQMEVLAQYATKEFEDRMVSHVKENWSEECGGMDAEAIRAFIRKGVDDAATYGIETEYDVARYLNVLVALGQDFDGEDTRFPWAAEILTDPDMNGREKMDKLCQRAEQELSALSEHGSSGG